ncbi:LysM peptidoglycan-binding domain-containing protein [Trichocoleus sp. DQ-A3]|uniref:CIS tube protein n=1 Tax=Cyanophyceae TaxID=3028117 RepID=UPI001689D086|nr:LysM peptidoglycan-binding domain-containing protein [Coleofasciculus sp. FACHB-125]MBD1903817.1 LysM peptidoglycan-binding domain-containing protein [Coleofasciculus sp. FACHB-125]
MALEKATITNLETGNRIPVMFNPEEYSLDLANTFAEIGIPGLKTPPIQYVRGNIRSLKMELLFDTFEKRRDVRNQTQQITSLLDNNPAKQAPPILLFSWGGFNFKCVLESVGQRFTMFREDGTPVRATLSVSFKEYQPVEIEIRKGLFIGPPTIRNIVEGETVSKLAGKFLGNPEAWREIAKLNNIDNPLKLIPGSQVVIPPMRRYLFDKTI